MSDNFSDFTKLVLARMESNPEEFCTLHMTGYSRWQGLTRGLEALARGDTHAKDFGVLWPLSDEERAALLESYRKLYLNELHRDMLKNIVSGADKPEIDPNTFTYKGNAVAGGRATTTLLTSSQMVKQAQGILEKEFDKQYAIGASDPRIAYGNAVEFSESEKRAKFQTVTLNPSQIAMATKMGVPLSEYAKHLDALSK